MIRVTLTIDIENNTDEDDDEYAESLSSQYDEGCINLKDLLEMSSSLDAEFDIA